MIACKLKPLLAILDSNRQMAIAMAQATAKIDFYIQKRKCLGKWEQPYWQNRKKDLNYQSALPSTKG